MCTLSTILVRECGSLTIASSQIQVNYFYTVIAGKCNISVPLLQHNVCLMALWFTIWNRITLCHHNGCQKGCYNLFVQVQVCTMWQFSEVQWWFCINRKLSSCFCAIFLSLGIRIWLCVCSFCHGWFTAQCCLRCRQKGNIKVKKKKLFDNF